MRWERCEPSRYGRTGIRCLDQWLMCSGLRSDARVLQVYCRDALPGPSQEAGGYMARSDRKCPNENCAMHGKATNLAVCHCCYRATVRSIYEPGTLSTQR
jgi:hypothetical protein